MLKQCYNSPVWLSCTIMGLTTPKSQEPCNGLDCSGGCNCNPEKGGRVRHTYIYKPLFSLSHILPLLLQEAFLASGPYPHMSQNKGTSAKFDRPSKSWVKDMK
uniref:Uncharacterized protein n=1 Tax=Oncorhynchus mykiss TaxID=8022 RepID=A0A8C7LTR0_ONCMY